MIEVYTGHGGKVVNTNTRALLFNRGFCNNGNILFIFVCL